MRGKDFRPKTEAGRPLNSDTLNEMAGQRDDTRPDNVSGPREMHLFTKRRGSRDQRPRPPIEMEVILEEVEGLEDISEEDLDPKASSAVEPADLSTFETPTQTGDSTQNPENPASAEKVSTELRAPVPGLPISSSPTTPGSPAQPVVV